MAHSCLAHMVTPRFALPASSRGTAAAKSSRQPGVEEFEFRSFDEMLIALTRECAHITPKGSYLDKDVLCFLAPEILFEAERLSPTREKNVFDDCIRARIFRSRVWVHLVPLGKATKMVPLHSTFRLLVRNLRSFLFHVVGHFALQNATFTVDAGAFLFRETASELVRNLWDFGARLSNLNVIEFNPACAIRHPPGIVTLHCGAFVTELFESSAVVARKRKVSLAETWTPGNVTSEILCFSTSYMAVVYDVVSLARCAHRRKTLFFLFFLSLRCRRVHTKK
jgi:hypothetical protein